MNCNKPGRKRSGRDQDQCCPGEQPHPPEQLDPHGQELQPKYQSHTIMNVIILDYRVTSSRIHMHFCPEAGVSEYAQIQERPWVQS